MGSVSVQAVVTNYHRLDGLNLKYLFLPVLEAVPAWLDSGESPLLGCILTSPNVTASSLLAS